MKKRYLKKGAILLCLCLLTAFSVSGQNTYCEPTWSGWAINEPTEPITLVQLGQNGVNGINNPTSDVVSSDTPRYEDFSAISMNVVRGESYTLKVKGNTDGNNTNYITVYFDWNGDGTFSNSTPANIEEQQQWTNQKEKHQYGMSLINSTGLDEVEVSYTVNIPTDAVLGATRMRIVKNYNAPSPAPCSNPFIFGQVEDYTINILALEDDCAAVETFFYDFNNFTTFPEQCWNWKISPENSNTFATVDIWEDENDASEKSVRIYPFVLHTHDFYLISPAVSTINGQYFLEFDARLFSALANGSTLQVGTLSSQTDVSGFTPVGDLIYPTLTDETYTTIPIPATDGHQYIAIKFDPAGNHSTVLIDNVEWKQLDNVSAVSVEVTTQDNIPAEITTENGTLQLVATVNPTDASQDVIWSVVTGSDFVSVDNNGLVTSITNGTAAIRATSVEDETVFGEINIIISNQQSFITDDPDVEWAGLFGGTGSDVGWAIATDNEGNSFTTGQFAGTVTFGTTTLTSAGGADIFVTKTSPSGEALWATQFGSTSTDMGWAVDTDSEGNVYVTGRFSGTVTFGNTTLTSAGNSDVFLIKINTSGTLVWAKQFGGTSADIGRAITVDTSGNVYVAGTFTGSVAFDSTSLTSSGGSDIFVVKTDSNGAVLWASQYGGSQADIAHGITVDTAGDIYITGQFAGNPVFGTETLTATGAIDSFVVKINASGTVIWTQQFEGVNSTDYNISENITADTLGNVYVTGELSGGAAFGSVTLTSSGTADIFVAKINNTGVILWAKQFGGTDSEVGYDIVTDAENDIYVTGYFNGISYFDSVILTSNGGNDIFVTKINSAGAVLWVKQFGGTGTDISRNIAVGLPDNIYITGQFADMVIFGEYTLTATGGNDVFIVKLGQANTSVCDNTEPGLNVGDTGCVSFTYNGETVSYTTVRGADGNIWLQQNLGSTAVAETMDDENSYGDYFQWGRWDDGHQMADSDTTTVVPTPNNPTGIADGLSSYITSSPSWWSSNDLTDEWTAPNVTSITETNGCDPCKALGEGWKLPTQEDWTYLVDAEDFNNPAGAFASTLKLPANGYRSSSNGGFTFVGQRGYYWSSTSTGIGGKYLYVGTTLANPAAGAMRGQGAAIRCVKSAQTNEIISVEVTTQDNVPAEITTENGTLQLVATVSPSDANQEVIWSVISGDDFASVDSEGLVTAIVNGTTTVRATSVEDETKFDEIEVIINIQDNEDPECEAVETFLETFENFTTFPEYCWNANYTNYAVGISDETVQLYSGGASGDNIIIVSPEVSTIDGQHALAFDMVSISQPGTTVQVGTMTDNTDFSTFSAVENAFAPTAGITHTTAAIPANTGHKYVAIKYSFPQGSHIVLKLDNIEWKEATSGTDGFDTYKVAVYPNPTTGIVNIQANEEITEFKVFNLTGQLILKGNSNTLNLDNFTSGIYLIQVTLENNSVHTHKLIKK